MNGFGEITWQATFGGNDNDDIYASERTKDNNLILAGTTFSNSKDVQNQQGKGDAWLIKVSRKGNLFWSVNYGGSKPDGASDVVATQDGGYLIGGVTRSYDKDVLDNRGYYDAWVVKVNANGEKLWTKNFGYEGKDGFEDLAEARGGGFIALGYSEQKPDGTQLPNHSGMLDYWLCNFSDPRREGVKPYRTPPTLNGIIRDKNSGKALEAEISITDNKSLDVLARAIAAPRRGDFALLLPPYGLLSINAVTPGYMFYGEDIWMDSIASKTMISRELRLEPIQIGSTLILENIYFDVGKWELLPPSFAELERLSKFLELNPRVIIEVSGHTDNTGNKDQKEELSLNRAEAVKSYLLQKGIKEERLKVRGFGMYRPIASNDTYLGRQKNRRVEFKVLNK